MSKQFLLRMSLPKGVRFFLNDFREALARSNKLPADFFSYDPETRRPQCQKNMSDTKVPTSMQNENPSAIPGVRIVGGESWVGILTNEKKRPLLDMATLPALAAVCEKTGVPSPIQLSEYEVDITPQEVPFHYFVREMVIRKGGGADMTEAALRALVKRRIIESIERQAHEHQIDCPCESEMGIFISEAIRSRGLRLVSSSGVTNQYMMLVDVKFVANIKLSGYWFAGNLTSRGYGRIGHYFGETLSVAFRRKGRK